jgi:photosystem II stability/assembly factor-like uncharacterized protein
MKKRIAIIILIQLSLLLSNCSSDSEDKSTPAPPPEITKAAKIISYSKNYGTTGETVTMKGENFTDQVSDIKITFDGVPATILSATTTEISFVLPSVEKLVPTLVLTILNRTIINNVKNNYNSSIGIAPAPSSTAWYTIPIDRKNESGIYRIQMINDKVLYYNTGPGGDVFRTLDGGITWVRWALNSTMAGFHATVNDEGWCHTGFGISKITAGGYLGIERFGNFDNNPNFIPTPFCIYVDNNLKNGTIVSEHGIVLSTINGIDFDKTYEVEVLHSNYIELANSAEFDNDHIWAVGHKRVADKGGILGERPFILYKNNSTDGWKEYSFVNEPSDYYAREICFTDFSNGFLLTKNHVTFDTKIYKTSNGGNLWSQVYNGEKFTKFTFKDANTGWAIQDNKIYKTINGGSVWTLEYTHDQPIKNISYKNNVVWAFSSEKIIKRYLQ